jgi:hypothetical protein
MVWYLAKHREDLIFINIRSKTIIDNTTMQQVSKFIYLGCRISYKEEKNITSFFLNKFWEF